MTATNTCAGRKQRFYLDRYIVFISDGVFVVVFLLTIAFFSFVFIINGVFVVVVLFSIVSFVVVVVFFIASAFVDARRRTFTTFSSGSLGSPT